MPSVLDASHAVALAITLVVEGLGMALFSAVSARQRSRVLRNTLVAIGTNLFTHTIFWYTAPCVDSSIPLGLCGFELIVVLVEALLYAAFCRLSLSQAGVLSLVLNFASFAVGVAVWTAAVR